MSGSVRAPAGVVRRLPISVRMGATVAVLFLVVLTALSGLAYWGLGQMLRADVDRSLVSAADTLDDDGSDADDIDEEEFGGIHSPEFETQVLAADGRLVDGSGSDMRAHPLISGGQVASALREGALFLEVVHHDEVHRALAVPLDEVPAEVLVVVAALDSVHGAQDGLLHTALALSPVACLLAGLTGWLVARRSLRPIARMTAEAGAMSARGPLPRLAVPLTGDEVARLGTTLNGLLDRIEDAQRREREFTADASHELRTPLAILRAELELARGSATTDGLGGALDSALEECDRLVALVDDLLLLARADAGQVAPRTLLDVTEVTDALLPGFCALAHRRGITLTSTGDAAVRADRRALTRAVANLLDNAIRHAPDRGHVGLAITQGPGGAAITVTDDGPGVPPERRERMTQRFAQLDRTRSGGGGAGLGLAIVASVAAAHGGCVDIADAPSGRGLAVTLHLPVTAPGPVVA